MDAYAAIYTLITGEESLEPTPPDIADRFTRGRFSSLVLYVRDLAHPSTTTPSTTFQEVHFSQANSALFRIELHDDKGTGTWAYFQRPGIGEKIHQIVQP